MDRRSEVLLTVQQALLGEITPNLRAVTVDWDDSSLRLQAWFATDPSPLDHEAMSLVATQLIAAFPSTHTVGVALHEWPVSQAIPKGETWVYLRKEDLE